MKIEILSRMATDCKKYIFWFAQEHVNFRRAEIDSIASTFGITYKNLQTDHKDETPFWIVELPNEDAAKIFASRSISLKCILELWGHSHSIPQFHKNVEKYVQENYITVNPYFSVEKTFKITVETYNKHFSQKEKIAKIESFHYLPLEGNVDLKTPNIEWWYIEFYGLNPKVVLEEPSDVLFGRWIADGQRYLLKELSLKNRKFIGNTSMDAQLSVLMANQAKVKNGDFVFDPFVGTGSLLVSAAKFGAYVLGSDIDYMMLHAKCRPSRITQKVREIDESVRSNLLQYGCADKYIDVLVSDFSNTIWRNSLQFDSIITDPPYGIREATEKIHAKTNTKPDTRTEDSPHYPSTSHYNLDHLYADLLSFSANHLKLNGILVCWLPVYKDDYSEEIIPRHPNLKLVANSEQGLSALTARRLLTYEKISNVTEETQNLDLTVNDFRERYFSYAEETRKERRIRRAQLREIGRIEALKRGKTISADGKVINSSNI